MGTYSEGPHGNSLNNQKCSLDTCRVVLWRQNSEILQRSLQVPHFQQGSLRTSGAHASKAMIMRGCFHTHRAVLLPAWVEETFFLFLCRGPRLIQSHHFSLCWAYQTAECSALKSTSVSSPTRPGKDHGRGDRKITRPVVCRRGQKRLPSYKQSHCGCLHKVGTH